MLWDEQTNEVWLDTDRDRSFAGERALKDYSTTRDMGTVGKDEPDTPEREQFAFTVQTAPARKAVAINMLNGGHATMVAGSAVGSRGTRGLYDGVAPGAQLIVIDYGGECIGGAIEGFIDAFADPRVDLVLFEQNVWLVQPYRLGDGRFPATIITSRLIEKYKKPFVVPGDNSPGVNAISEHGNARWGFAVGAYEAKESYRINDGFLVEHDDNLHHVGVLGAERCWRRQARHPGAVRLSLERGSERQLRASGSEGPLSPAAGLRHRRRHVAGDADDGGRAGTVDERRETGARALRCRAHLARGHQ